MDNRLTQLKIINAIAYVVMVTVNVLANTIPINGITAGEVSALYPNLFAPASITFSIWGVIYLLLGLFILYSFGVFKGKTGYSDDAVKRIGFAFVISSLANVAWIFAWHYQKIGLSLILMMIIFVSLLISYKRIYSKELTLKEDIFVGVPFSVYFAWITIALIANVTTYLVSIGWNGFNIAEPIWMILIVIVGLLISVAVIRKYNDIAYGIVIIWAYIGILIKHVSEDEFAGEYKGVIVTVIISIIILAVATIVQVFKSDKARR